MRKSFITLVFFLFLILSCKDSINDSIFNPDNYSARLLSYNCHQTVNYIAADSTPSHLAITAHSKKVSYPGVRLHWLEGNISHLKNADIIINNPDSSRDFYLFMWDGNGEMKFHNRFHYECKYTGNNFDTLKISFENGMKTHGGREMDLSNIELVTLYTVAREVPFTFSLYDIKKYSID